MVNSAGIGDTRLKEAGGCARFDGFVCLPPEQYRYRPPEARQSREEEEPSSSLYWGIVAEKG
jgi:hypothetical protein